MSSTYTMELRTVCEYVTREEVENYFKNYNLEDYLTTEQIEVITSNGIWTKDKLASKIVDHYYMREIGYETIGLFKHYAKVYMREIMERKLPLIYTNNIKYNPLINVDYKEEFTRDTSGTSNSSGTNNASGLSVNSDTPQGQISKSGILAGDFASNTGASETTSSVSDTSSSSGNETYTKTIKGNSGVSATSQKMIEQYRQNIIAVDEDIIKELNKLFMGLY